MFEGSYVAIVTPFKNGKIDEEAFARLIEMHANAGTDGILPCGTTGESPVLTQKEHEDVISMTVRLVNKRMKVMAGTGSNCTAEAVEYTKSAEKAGADAALVVNPYYNKPGQRGLYEHFKTIARSVKIPIIVYNIQSRTSVNVETSTLEKLAEIENIKGVKEASGSLSQMSDVIRRCGDDFDVLSGDDALTLPLLAVGGKGIISVAANIIPQDVKALVEAFNKNDIKEARRLHNKMAPLVKAMFCETNPVPLKAAMAMMGMIEPEIRLPLTEPSDENKALIKKALEDYGLKVK
ncbi:MAG: 4-hydroxy-tetrahydrodipicolinate synthase [Candidatus Goldiibacteriota bacterium]